MKNSLKLWVSITIGIFTCNMCEAQNFIKTDLALSFLGGKKLVQAFDFNLNRTDEAQNNNGGVYFLYTARTNFYIIPTVDANIGESVSTASNNIITQVTFGKMISVSKKKNGLNLSFFKFAAEINPTYNSDKTFAEKLYYAQIKVILNPIFDHFDGTPGVSLIRRELSIAVDPILNIGSHDSKTYNIQQSYSSAGLNTSFILRFNKLDSKGTPYEDWNFKISGNGYRLFSEIDALYAKDYYGQLSASVDKAVTSKCALSTSYKYGNENAKYNTINTLAFGFKYKF
jgi:hypothetical protein